MSGRKPFIAKDKIKEFNEMRTLMQGISLTEEQIKEALHARGIPSNINFWQELKNSNLIYRTSKDTYKFSDPTKPVHHSELQEIYNRYHAKCVVKAMRRKDMKEFNINKTRVYDSVKFLESIGFIVLAPSKLYLKQ